MSEKTRGRRKALVGTVVSTKMDKTAVVSVERRYPHPLYQKIMRSTKRYKAHDADNSAVLGDLVRIVETRPLSKEKRWRIAETMVRGNVAEIAPREIGAPEESLYHPEAPQPAATAAVAEASPAAEAQEPAAAVAEETAVAADEETAVAADEETAVAADEETAVAADGETAVAAKDETAAEVEPEAEEDSKE